MCLAVRDNPLSYWWKWNEILAAPPHSRAHIIIRVYIYRSLSDSPPVGIQTSTMVSPSSFIASQSRQSVTIIFSQAFRTISSAMVTAKKYVLVKHFEGEPKRSDLQLVEEKLPALKDGEFLAEAEYLSLDPYMRPYALRYPVGITMIGAQVAKIVDSKDPEYPIGKRIVGYLGWRTHTIVNMKKDDSFMNTEKPYIIPDFGGLPVSLALGALGMPGNTARFGLLEICKPKKGETLVVSGAAGAVGAHVGQIGKSMGLKVIGIAGSDKKCDWLKEELSFDHAINYKTQNIAAELKKAAPNGVDCYFDNVGGDISTTVIYQMNLFGRIAVCGSISTYNADMNQLPKTTLLQPAVVFKQLKMEGFIVQRWPERWMEGIDQNLQTIRDGKLKYHETITEGFDKMFDAFVGMLRGENTGKAIVKV